MGAFLASLFGGNNPTLDKTINTAGSLEGFSQGVGQSATTDANKFYHSILSGDPSQEASALAPEINANQQATQQLKNQVGQFGTRSGGTGGTVAGADSDAIGNILKLIGGLKTTAAQGEAGIGATNLSQAAVTNGQQAELSQQRLKNMIDSILGGATTAATSVGLGALGI